jgi:hypothetical protein
MTPETRIRYSNILTILASIIAVMQTMLSSAPLSPVALLWASTLLTYSGIVTTAWKQVLSPNVSEKAFVVTVWIAAAATLGGVADLLKLFNLPEQTAQLIRWAITCGVTIINILSKQLFPNTNKT